jgi:predicted TIM-barrel fold metal-dependent hydrolase
MTVQNHYTFRLRPGMRQGLRTEVPLPTRLVSNEEFPPLPQTTAQREVEERILTAAGRLGPWLGLSRRDFLRTSGGMATALLAMNAVFGRFFDVTEIEAAEPAAFQERRGEPFFIFDVQLHYVGVGYDPDNAEAQRPGAVTKEGLLGLRQQSRRLNPQLASDRGTLTDLSWANFVKEVFLDSETAIGLISTPPGPYPQEAVVPPKEMTHIRDEINRITQSRRMLAHGLVTPQLGQADLEFMEMQAATLKVDAWKAYTGAAPKGFEHGWFLDDEQVAYPMLEKARALGVRRLCVHKGLPLGPVADYNHPRDLIKAAKDFPDIDFLVYHAGLLGVAEAQASGNIPWTTELCAMKKQEPSLTNIYMELGSTFGQLVTTNPTACAHLLGQVIEAFGADHVLWGTQTRSGTERHNGRSKRSDVSTYPKRSLPGTTMRPLHAR